MRWLPQPLISAAGSNLRQTYTVQLAATTRLLLREEQLLGRADERPGHTSSVDSWSAAPDARCLTSTPRTATRDPAGTAQPS
ncbi:urease accessory protein UreD [Streptomyces lydicus]